MAAVSVTLEELDELGRKLDAADLTDKEREVLATVFQMAAAALGEEEEEVSGFSFGFGAPNPGGPLSLGGMFQNSYSSGPNSDPDPGQGGIHISGNFGAS